jgi:hypothetical protein
VKENIDLVFDKDELFEYLMLAHRLDITFNQLVENVLRDAMEECKKDPNYIKKVLENKD